MFVGPGETWTTRGAPLASGKDGTTWMVVRASDGTEGVLKVFKTTKSLSVIKQEMGFQQRAAEAGIAPLLLSNPTFTTEKQKAFVMQPMKRTLLAVIKDQSGLTPEQAEQIVTLYDKLSDLQILHNDGNVTRNIMEGPNQRFFLIDFGFSKHFDPKKHKLGPKPNYTMLAHIDEALAKTKSGRVFEAVIAKYNQTYHVVVDVAAESRRKQAERLAAAKAQLQAR